MYGVFGAAEKLDGIRVCQRALDDLGAHLSEHVNILGASAFAHEASNASPLAEEPLSQMAAKITRRAVYQYQTLPVPFNTALDAVAFYSLIDVLHQGDFSDFIPLSLMSEKLHEISDENQ